MFESIDTQHGYSYRGHSNIMSSNNSGENIGVNEHGRLKVYTDYNVFSDLLTLKRTKASHLALDGGYVISKIIEM